MSAATPADGADHQPDKETWDCLACDQPWPCDPAKTYLKATMNPVQLGIAQWDYMEQAIFVLHLKLTTREYWDRFLAWTRRPIP